METKDAFFMVHSRFGPPRCEHPNYESAFAEASRLARENPGNEFTVLMAVKGVKKQDVHLTDYRPTDDIPF